MERLARLQRQLAPALAAAGEGPGAGAGAGAGPGAGAGAGKVGRAPAGRRPDSDVAGPAHGAEVGPASNFYVSQRLRLHYLDWSNEGPYSGPARPLLVLVHGGRDHARAWDDVARQLRSDYHVVAPDLRGHGDSAWCVWQYAHAFARVCECVCVCVHACTCLCLSGAACATRVCWAAR
jgi:hypothetical protein